jgi:hypothetical protein
MWIPKNKIMAKQIKIQFADDNYANGGVTYSEWSKDDFWQEQFQEWMEDGNVIKFEDGYSTQDAQYRNRLKNMSDLKRYFYKEFIKGQQDSYADGGSTDDKHLVAKAIEYITGYAVDTDSIVEKDLRYNFTYKNRNVSSSLNSKLVHDTIRMNKKSLESRYTPSLANKYAKGGEIQVNGLTQQEYIDAFNNRIEKLKEKLIKEGTYDAEDFDYIYEIQKEGGFTDIEEVGFWLFNVNYNYLVDYMLISDYIDDWNDTLQVLSNFYFKKPMKIGFFVETSGDTDLALEDELQKIKLLSNKIDFNKVVGFIDYEKTEDNTDLDFYKDSELVMSLKGDWNESTDELDTTIDVNGETAELNYHPLDSMGGLNKKQLQENINEALRELNTYSAVVSIEGYEEYAEDVEGLENAKALIQNIKGNTRFQVLKGSSVGIGKRVDDSRVVEEFAKGGRAKNKKGDIGKSGTQYGYTLAEWERGAKKRGLLVSPTEYWKSIEGTKYKDSFGRTQTMGRYSSDKENQMNIYGYIIAIGMDLGSKKIPASAIRYVQKNNFTKYAKGGKANTDIYDYDEKMALINLGQVYEYAIKLDKMIKDDTDLEEWVKMKLTRIEQNIADVKHSLEGWEKYKGGGEIPKKQLLHIAKYSKDLIEMIQGGSRLMSWQEDKLAVSSDSIDNIYHHLDYQMGNRAEDLDVDNEYAKGGEAGFDDAGTSMVMYHEKKGNFIVPKGQVYLWLYDVEDSGEKINSEEYDYVMYPFATRSMSWQSGYIPPLKKIWTKKFQKTHKGAEHLLGVIKAYLIEKDGKKELYIDMMSVNPKKKKKGIMSYMIKDLRDTFKLTQDQVTFSDLTPEGEKFIAKKTYSDGGSTYDDLQKLLPKEKILKLLKETKFKSFDSSKIESIEYDTNTYNPFIKDFRLTINCFPCIIEIYKISDNSYEVVVAKDSGWIGGISNDSWEYIFEIPKINYEEFEKGLKKVINDKIITLYNYVDFVKTFYFVGTIEEAEKFAKKNGYKVELDKKGEITGFYREKNNPSLSKFESKYNYLQIGTATKRQIETSRLDNWGRSVSGGIKKLETYASGGGVNDLEIYINIDKMNPMQYEIVKNYNTLKALAKNGFIELHEKTGLRYKNYERKDKYRENRVTNVRHDYIKSATSPKFEFNNRNFAIGYIKGLNFEELYVLEDMSNK